MAKNEKRRARENVGRDNAPTLDTSEIESRIVPLNKMKSELSVLIYGRSGTGKTTLACTFPAPFLLLDIRDEGTDSVADVPGHAISIHTWDDFEAVGWYLQKHYKKYKTVIIDNLTQLQTLAITKVREEEGLSNEDPMSRRLWGQAAGLMQRGLMLYHELPINRVYIAQDRISEPEEDVDAGADQIIPEVGPAVQPSVAKMINASVQMIIHTFIKEVVTQKDGTIKRRMEFHGRIGPHPYYLTKVRAPKKFKIPASIKDPTYEKLMAIKKGEYTHEKA